MTAAPPAFGDACGAGEICAIDGGRLGIGCTRDGSRFVCPDTRCSRPCESGGDCAAPLGTCSFIPAFGGNGPSQWCAP